MTKQLTKFFVCLFVLALPLQGLTIPLMMETTNSNWHFWGDRYTDISPDGSWGGNWIGNDPWVDNSLTWSHTLPTDFQVPPYRVDRAKLWIDAHNNVISIRDDVSWYYNNTIQSTTNTNLTDFWSSHTPYVPTPGGVNSSMHDQPISWEDYAAVPEPATIILFGAGLLGIGLYRRKKSSC